MRILFVLISMIVSFIAPYGALGTKVTDLLVVVLKTALVGLRPFLDGCKVLAAAISLYEAITKQRDRSHQTQRNEVLEESAPRLLLPLAVFAAGITLVDSVVTLIETIIR